MLEQELGTLKADHLARSMSLKIEQGRAQLACCPSPHTHTHLSEASCMQECESAATQRRSRNADSACPFLPSRQYKKGHAESAFRDACRTSSGCNHGRVNTKAILINVFLLHAVQGMAACSDLDNTSMGMFNCSILETYSNCTEQLGDVCSNGGLCESEPDLFKGVTIVLVFAISLIGNLCTILILSQFKTHKIPDVLVIGLALTDLLATIIPIAAAMYSYFSGFDFVPGCVVCNISGTVAQFTRYSSSLIVTLVSLERYFAVCRPFIYRQHATPKRFVIILILCWLVALVLATIPLMGFNTDILSFDGVCLFDLTSNYAIAIVLYAAVQYVIVFVCFVLVATELCKVYRRRKKLKVQGEYNDNSMARHRSRTQSVTTFTKPNLTSRYVCSKLKGTLIKGSLGPPDMSSILLYFGG